MALIIDFQFYAKTVLQKTIIPSGIYRQFHKTVKDTMQRFENWAFNADHKGKVEMLMHVNSPEEPRRR